MSVISVFWFVICASSVQAATRQELLDYFDNTWTLTEVLFSGLQVSPPTPNPTFVVSLLEQTKIRTQFPPFPSPTCMHPVWKRRYFFMLAFEDNLLAHILVLPPALSVIISFTPLYPSISLWRSMYISRRMLTFYLFLFMWLCVCIGARRFHQEPMASVAASAHLLLWTRGSALHQQAARCRACQGSC